MTASPLPDFRDPPVDEIVAAVQFSPLVSFRLPEVVRLDRALDAWELVEAREALDPIVEAPPGLPSTGRIGFGFGTPPQRAIFVRGDGRWQLQVQHDRIALNQSRIDGARPSASQGIPELRAQAKRIAVALDAQGPGGCPGVPELVELVYVNRIDEDRGFTTWGRLGELLAGIGERPGRGRLLEPEGMQAAWAFPLLDGDQFVGRLRAEVAPAAAGGAQLQLNSRRYVHQADPFDVLERCHEDIVRGFDDMTTPAAHDIWGKLG